MQIVIDIPDHEIPKKQDIISVDIHFIDGEVCECTYGFQVLPKGHGRLGDLDALRKEVSSWGMNDYEPSDFTDEIDRVQTIIEADKQSDPHEMTHREKFCKLFDELGIEYNITEGGNIQLDPFYVDGAEDFYIDFWDGEDYPDGEFKEFMVYGDAELEGGHHD